MFKIVYTPVRFTNSGGTRRWVDTGVRAPSFGVARIVCKALSLEDGGASPKFYRAEEIEPEKSVQAFLNGQFVDVPSVD